MEQIQKWAEQLKESVEAVFFGKSEVIDKILVAILCRGHVLLEDVPGVGKTILARAIAKSIGAEFARIQCTPDLLPADVIGVSIFNPKENNFRFRKGPILSNFVLVDEINRATPRTQAALLEAMAENQISVEGRQLPLPEPFFLIATENPVEFEGTFPLPEAQKDRFLMSLKIGYPDRTNEERIIASQRRITHPVQDVKAVTTKEEVQELQQQIVQIHMDPAVLDYMMNLIEATRTDSSVDIGISPRGTLALYKACQALAALRGRDFVTPEDVKELAPSVFEKRIILKSDALIRGITADTVIDGILEQVEVPVLKEQ